MNSRRGMTGCPWLWLLVLCWAGCSGAPAAIPPQPLDAYQFQETRGGVGVGVDPYFTVERVARTFRGGESFAENGVLPVRVTIHNGSREEVTVNPRDFRLVRPNGSWDIPLSAQDAFSLTKVRLGLWGAVTIIGGPITAARNEPRLKDLEARELQETTISPGNSSTGFVYFGIPPEEKNMTGSRVMLVLRSASRQDLSYEIPVEGRRDIPQPPGAPEASGAPGPSGARAPAPTSPSGLIIIEGTGGGVIIRNPAQ